MRFIATLFFCAGIALAVAGCETHKAGPDRHITLDDDVAWVRDLAEPKLSSFYSADLQTQAAIRNQIVTARMYITDMEYHYYEARLTKEMQEEGLAATVASLGLTTASTLVPVAQTKTLLSALATGVIGLDKAYNEKELLSNTIQALQTQMRADRKTEAGVIYAKMYKDAGNRKTITPITEYTLPMALSDSDAYYQAGTLSSALIGLTRTVATAEQNADQAKSAAGPNPEAVSTVKEIAAARVPAQFGLRPAIIHDVNAPLRRISAPPPPPGSSRIGAFEIKLSQKDMNSVLDTLCLSGVSDLGPAASSSRKSLSSFLAANGKTASEIISRNVFLDIQDLQLAGKRNCP